MFLSDDGNDDEIYLAFRGRFFLFPAAMTPDTSLNARYIYTNAPEDLREHSRLVAQLVRASDALFKGCEFGFHPGLTFEARHLNGLSHLRPARTPHCPQIMKRTQNDFLKEKDVMILSHFYFPLIFFPAWTAVSSVGCVTMHSAHV